MTWNSISPVVRKLGKTSFNNKIRDSLLFVLENEDDYVDTPTSIKLMAKQWSV